MGMARVQKRGGCEIGVRSVFAVFAGNLQFLAGFRTISPPSGRRPQVHQDKRFPAHASLHLSPFIPHPHSKQSVTVSE